MLRPYDIVRIYKTAKAIRTKELPRFFIFCFLTICQKLFKKPFYDKSFVLRVNGKLFELRIGKGEFDFLYETNVMRLYQPDSNFIPSPFFVAIDVGANFGSASIQWHRTLTKGVIYSIEPHHGTFRRLLKHIQLNKAEDVIRPFNVALGSKDGSLSLFVTASGTMATKDRPADSGEEMEVSCLTLDSFTEKHHIGHMDLIKIDAEGFEYDILEGAARSLERTQRIILEYHSAFLKEKCSKLLENEGFLLTERGPLLFGEKKSDTVE